MTTFPAFKEIREPIARSSFRKQAEKSVRGQLEGGQKYLVALSGGPDSVAVAILLWALGFRIGCAHMNYHLRGKDSDADEDFCRALCAELELPSHFRSVRLKDDFNASRKSWQELARDLRYAFFDELIEQHGYDAVITAHHLDDSVETFFNNLIRGTGIEGLTGIPGQRGKILRPFLEMRKMDILLFLGRFSIPYRKDASNEGVDYLRNQVRHRVIPACTEGNASFLHVMDQNMDRLKAVQDWLSGQIENWKKHYFRREGGADLFLRSGFSQDTPIILIYQLFKGYGFQWTEMGKLKKILVGQPGKMLSSRSHTLLVDREMVMVQTRADESPFHPISLTREVLTDGMIVDLPSGRIEVQKKLAVKGPEQDGKTVMCIPLQVAEFPLVIRTWQPGDRFQPSGMEGKHQNVSDLLTNLKLDRLNKKNVCVLADRKQILWVIGYRMAKMAAEWQHAGPCVWLTYFPS